MMLTHTTIDNTAFTLQKSRTAIVKSALDVLCTRFADRGGGNPRGREDLGMRPTPQSECTQRKCLLLL